MRRPRIRFGRWKTEQGRTILEVWSGGPLREGEWVVTLSAHCPWMIRGGKGRYGPGLRPSTVAWLHLGPFMVYVFWYPRGRHAHGPSRQ